MLFIMTRRGSTTVAHCAAVGEAVDRIFRSPVGAAQMPQTFLFAIKSRRKA